MVPKEGYPLEFVKVQGLKGKGFWGLIKGLLALPLAFLASFRILSRQKPDVVVGVGGYASGPVVLAAWMMGIPTAIQEQNALPGLTNKVLGRIVKVVFTAFEEARAFFPEAKVQMIGNPIRRKLMDNYLRSSAAHEKFSVLIFGGSLGARGLNNRMLDALDFLGDLKDQVSFVHQTGKNDLETVKKGYADKGFGAQATVVEFIDDMSSAYAQADLVICRAGALTVCELAAAGLPSFLVPLPHAIDDHQTRNAEYLAKEGAAVLLPQANTDAAALAAQLTEVMMHPEKLKAMGATARRLARPDATRTVVDICLEVAHG